MQGFFRNALTFCLISFMFLSGLFLFIQPPSFAAMAQQTQSSKPMATSPVDREKAYEEAVKDAKDIESVEETYEENLKEFKQENPQPNIIEKTENLIENARGEK